MPALLAVPVRLGERRLGVVLGDRGGTPFALEPDQLAFAQALANQAALALEIGRLREASPAGKAQRA